MSRYCDLKPQKNGRCCWYMVVDEKMLAKLPVSQRAKAKGRYLILEDVDLFEQGELVTWADIMKQYAVWRTGRLPEEHRRQALRTSGQRMGPEAINADHKADQRVPTHAQS